MSTLKREAGADILKNPLELSSEGHIGHSKNPMHGRSECPRTLGTRAQGPQFLIVDEAPSE